jgi:hypothetical protein
MLVLAGVFFVFGFVEILRGIATAPKGEVDYVLGYGLGQAIGGVLVLGVLTLIVGGGVYVYYRFRREDPTFVRALFSWPVVVLAACLALVYFVA